MECIKALKITNKEIYLLRLSVTQECVLNCAYCFVKKGGRTISCLNAKKAVDLLLGSPGQDKLLMVYGGEPFLKFELVKQIIKYAKNKAKHHKKNLRISLGTNGILADKDKIGYLKDEGIKLAVSIDGTRCFHDKARVFPDKKGSFADVMAKIHLIVKNIKKENLCVLFGILPSSTDAMFDNLIFINDLGIDSVNIEPVESPLFSWDQRQSEVFKVNLRRYIDFIYNKIFNKKYFFLNTINRELENKRLSGEKKACLFYQNLEVDTSGDMAFSSFLINSNEKKDYIVGNLEKGFAKEYRDCLFDLKSESCRQCWKNYTGGKLKALSGGAALEARNAMSVGFSKKILKEAQNNRVAEEYIRQAKKRIFD